MNKFLLSLLIGLLAACTPDNYATKADIRNLINSESKNKTVALDEDVIEVEANVLQSDLKTIASALKLLEETNSSNMFMDGPFVNLNEFSIHSLRTGNTYAYIPELCNTQTALKAFKESSNLMINGLAIHINENNDQMSLNNDFTLSLVPVTSLNNLIQTNIYQIDMLLKKYGEKKLQLYTIQEDLIREYDEELVDLKVYSMILNALKVSLDRDLNNELLTKDVESAFSFLNFDLHEEFSVKESCPN